MSSKNSPLVSVCVQTYNQESYIRECLDGILMQQTTFPYEIILGEDESSDGTRDICKAYAKKHPDKIRLFLRSRKDVIYINGNATGRYNFIENLKACSGKYIALCEGDDYWTDPLKLQKQVDFLEGNLEFGICFHNVVESNIFTKSRNVIPGVKTDQIFTVYDYVLNNKTATCSILFRADVLKEGIPSWFALLPFGDLGVILSVLKVYNKKGMVLRDEMGVYRVHEGGIHGAFQKSDKGLIKAYEQHLMFTSIIEKNLLSEPLYKKTILKKYINVYSVLIKLYKREGRLAQLIKLKILKTFTLIKFKLLK